MMPRRSRYRLLVPLLLAAACTSEANQPAPRPTLPRPTTTTIVQAGQECPTGDGFQFRTERCP